MHDTSVGLLSAIGGEDVHPLGFVGPEIMPEPHGYAGIPPLDRAPASRELDLAADVRDEVIEAFRQVYDL